MFLPRGKEKIIAIYMPAVTHWVTLHSNRVYNNWRPHCWKHNNTQSHSERSVELEDFLLVCSQLVILGCGLFPKYVFIPDVIMQTFFFCCCFFTLLLKFHFKRSDFFIYWVFLIMLPLTVKLLHLVSPPIPLCVGFQFAHSDLHWEINLRLKNVSWFVAFI